MVCRGGFGTRPYRIHPYRIRPYNPGVMDNNDSMHMIRHNNKCVQRDVQIMVGEVVPCELNQVAKIV